IASNGSSNGPHVSLDEPQVVGRPALLGDREQRRLAVDAHDRARRPDELERPHAGADPGHAQQPLAGTGDRGGLAVEPRDLVGIAAEDVLGHGSAPSVSMACLTICADMIAPTRLRCSPSLWRRITAWPLTTAE